jgi:hypothetical protein
MPAKAKTNDPVLTKLNSIEQLLQDILILQGAQAGMKKAQVRKMVGVGATRVTRIWKNIKTQED